MTEQERYAKFAQEAEDAGFEVTDYQGRNFYDGPAVILEDGGELQDLIRATSMRLQTDSLGKGLIAYPC